MNFTEPEFWPRLFAGLFIIALVRFFLPKTPAGHSVFDRVSLAALSLYLLSCVGWLTTGIFLCVFFTTWMLVLLMFRLPAEKRKLVLWGGIPLLCFPLIYYKYRVFIAVDVLSLDPDGFTHLAIPAGISFYTFQKIGMLVDASRMEKWKPRLLDYLNFATFFPQVVAGPIERKEGLFPQMENFSFKWSRAWINEGIPWIALGLFYKLCLADNLGSHIDREAMASVWPILLSTFLFGLKIYFDFCGYSLMALGIAHCLGIRLTLNFRSPYWSSSIREFWRKWHISLSYWFRDYIYIPMGGGRGNRWWLNLMFVFIISGIWHGAGWCFLIWGGMHGFFSVISHVLKDRIRLPSIAGWAITLSCVFLAWLPFYETRLNVLAKKVRILADVNAWSLSGLRDLVHSREGGDWMALATVTCLAISAILMEGLIKWRHGEDYHHARHPLMIAFCIVCVIFLGASNANEFIYFAF